MANHREIAAEAGVCAATVSLALRGHPSIPAATRGRIRAVAERLGYRPNARVAELMGEIRRRRSVERITESAALVWADVSRSGCGQFAHLREFEEAVREGLGRQGIGLECFYEEDKRVERVLVARGVRGVIFAPLVRLPHRHLRWDWSRFSVVVAGSSLWRPAFHRVRFNHFEEMRLILHHLRHGGYRRPGLVVSRAVNERAGRAPTGAFRAHGGPGALLPGAVFESDGNDRAGFLRWLARHRPDVLILAVAGAVEWVGEAGYGGRVVLADILLAGAGEYDGIEESYAQLGHAAAERLFGMLALHQFGVPEHPLETALTGTWRGHRAGGRPSARSRSAD